MQSIDSEKTLRDHTKGRRYK